PGRVGGRWADAAGGASPRDPSPGASCDLLRHEAADILGAEEAAELSGLPRLDETLLAVAVQHFVARLHVAFPRARALVDDLREEVHEHRPQFEETLTLEVEPAALA